jgi:5'-nucleotidase
MSVTQNTRKLILVSNDDGVLSPGLHALAESVLDLGDVIIAAPVEQQTSMSRSKKRTPDSGTIRPVTVMLNGQPVTAYGVVGTPALATLHGLLEIAPRMPDLMLSGINYGENMGYSMTTAGTLGAALEAGAFHVPALAFSLETPAHMHHASEYASLDWRATQHVAHALAKQILEQGMPWEVGVFNVNVPSDATEDTEWRWTRQSAINYYQWSSQGARALDKPHLLRMDKKTTGAEEDSDVRAIAIDRVISITPLLRNLTALRFLDAARRGAGVGAF